MLMRFDLTSFPRAQPNTGFGRGHGEQGSWILKSQGARAYM